MNQKKVEIVLADDHKILRRGIRALLEAEPDLKVIGEAADGLSAVKLVESLHPDVVVLDISMPGMNGINVTKQVRKRSPSTRVIILSMHSAEVYVQQALEARATGYILKESGPEQLVQAIREVMRGGYYLGPPFSGESLETYRKRRGDQADGTGDSHNC